jgi:hypothetical protein
MKFREFPFPQEILSRELQILAQTHEGTNRHRRTEERSIEDRHTAAEFMEPEAADRRTQSYECPQ